MRTPTPKQMSFLAAIPVGTAVLTPRSHDWRPLLNHGWVERADAEDGVYWPLPPLRITPDGLRALADAIERHGQPEPAPPRTMADARWWGAANPHALDVEAA